MFPPCPAWPRAAARSLGTAAPAPASWPRERAACARRKPGLRPGPIPGADTEAPAPRRLGPPNLQVPSAVRGDTAAVGGVCGEDTRARAARAAVQLGLALWAPGKLGREVARSALDAKFLKQRLFFLFFLPIQRVAPVSALRTLWNQLMRVVGSPCFCRQLRALGVTVSLKLGLYAGSTVGEVQNGERKTDGIRVQERKRAINRTLLVCSDRDCHFNNRP